MFKIGAFMPKGSDLRGSHKDIVEAVAALVTKKIGEVTFVKAVFFSGKPVPGLTGND